jgi:hypothetical protein
MKQTRMFLILIGLAALFQIFVVREFISTNFKSSQSVYGHINGVVAWHEYTVETSQEWLKIMGMVVIILTAASLYSIRKK